MTEFFDHYNIDLNFQYFPLFKYILFLFKNVFWLKIVNVLLLLKFIFFHKEGKFINSKVFLKMPQPKQSPVRKSLNDIKVKYSPIKKLIINTVMCLLRGTSLD